MEELTQEQLKDLKKAKRNVIFVTIFLVLSHVLWIFTSNLFLSVLSLAYFHNPTLCSAASVAISLVILMGLRETLSNTYDKYNARVKEIENPQSN